MYVCPFDPRIVIFRGFASDRMTSISSENSTYDSSKKKKKGQHARATSQNEKRKEVTHLPSNVGAAVGKGTCVEFSVVEDAGGKLAVSDSWSGMSSFDLPSDASVANSRFMLSVLRSSSMG